MKGEVIITLRKIWVKHFKKTRLFDVSHIEWFDFDLNLLPMQKYCINGGNIKTILKSAPEDAVYWKAVFQDKTKTTALPIKK